MGNEYTFAPPPGQAPLGQQPQGNPGLNMNSPELQQLLASGMDIMQATKIMTSKQLGEYKMQKAAAEAKSAEAKALAEESKAVAAANQGDAKTAKLTADVGTSEAKTEMVKAKAPRKNPEGYVLPQTVGKKYVPEKPQAGSGLGWGSGTTNLTSDQVNAMSDEEIGRKINNPASFTEETYKPLSQAVSFTEEDTRTKSTPKTIYTPTDTPAPEELDAVFNEPLPDITPATGVASKVAADAEKMGAQAAATGEVQAPKTLEEDATTQSGMSKTAIADMVEKFNSNPENMAAMEELRKAYAQDVSDQRTGLQEARGINDEFNAIPIQTDLSPLMSLADSWYGKGDKPLTAGYTKPMTPEQRLQAKMLLQQSLQKSRGGVTEAQKGRFKQYLDSKKDELDNKIKAMGLDAKNAHDKASKLKDDKAANQNRKTFNDMYGKDLEGRIKLQTSLMDLEKVMERHGGKMPLPGSGSDFVIAQQALGKALTLTNKYEAELGALAGADLELLQKQIGLSTNLWTQAMKENWFKISGLHAIKKGIAENKHGVERSFSRSEGMRKTLNGEADGQYSTFYEVANGKYAGDVPDNVGSMGGGSSGVGEGLKAKKEAPKAKDPAKANSTQKGLSELKGM